jgi:hypothetical protein
MSMHIVHQGAALTMILLVTCTRRRPCEQPWEDSVWILQGSSRALPGRLQQETIMRRAATFLPRLHLVE